MLWADMCTQVRSLIYRISLDWVAGWINPDLYSQAETIDLNKSITKKNKNRESSELHRVVPGWICPGRSVCLRSPYRSRPNTLVPLNLRRSLFGSTRSCRPPAYFSELSIPNQPSYALTNLRSTSVWSWYCQRRTVSPFAYWFPITTCL